MNRIIETIEKERIVKKYRRNVDNDLGFLNTVPKPIREYFKKENIKSVEFKRGGEKDKKYDVWLIEYNDEPENYHVYSDDKVPEPENSMLKEWLKKYSQKLTIAEQDQTSHRDFSKVNLFAGEEYNQELRQIENQINLIDFNQHNHENPEFIEKKVKEICNNPQNQELIEKGEFPVICFKNIEKIGRNKALEEALLPIFDTQQNTELFNKEVDLSKFILIATTSTYETEKLSDPLLSRLDWVNADTAQPKKFFLDKYYYWLLVPSLLANLILLGLILLPKLRRNKGKAR